MDRENEAQSSPDAVEDYDHDLDEILDLLEMGLERLEAAEHEALLLAQAETTKAA